MTPRFIPSQAIAWWQVCVAFAFGSLLPACTSMGEGAGATIPDLAPVTFNWVSKDGGVTGALTATMSDGSAFTGPFLQITEAARVDTLGSLWTGWHQGWNDWPYWGALPDTAFVTRYSGRVVANLKGPGEHRLRCRFHLNDPIAGMRGGGQGECQGSDGRTIDAVFARR